MKVTGEGEESREGRSGRIPGGASGDEIGGVAQRVPPGEGADAAEDGDGGRRLEAADVDELAEAELVGEDEVALLLGQGGVDGVGGVGDLEEEALVGEEAAAAADGWDDIGHLQQRRWAAGPGAGGVGVAAGGVLVAGRHLLEELLEDARAEGGRHSRSRSSLLRPGNGFPAMWRQWFHPLKREKGRG